MVSIMYGCNNFCTYCIVPYVRGAERSRSPEDILAEVRSLVEGGCKEITLLGQNVNSYGKYGNDGCDFSELLRQIAELPGDFLIRFMTSHPRTRQERLSTPCGVPEGCKTISSAGAIRLRPGSCGNEPALYTGVLFVPCLLYAGENGRISRLRQISSSVFPERPRRILKIRFPFCGKRAMIWCILFYTPSGTARLRRKWRIRFRRR